MDKDLLLIAAANKKDSIENFYDNGLLGKYVAFHIYRGSISG